VEHMAQRASLTRELFVCWVTGMGGPAPTVINDLKPLTLPNGQRAQLDMSRHLSMNAIRMLLIEIRKQLEVIAAEGQTPNNAHDPETLKKVNGLLRDFQSASTAYEARMNEFKQMQQARLLDGCRQKGAALEMLCVVGSGENGEPKSEWVKVTVHSFDPSANRVLVNKGPRGEMSYAAIDSATLRLPMATSPDILDAHNLQGVSSVAVNGPSKVQAQSLPVMSTVPRPMQAQSVPVQPQPHWNMSLSRNNVSGVQVQPPSLGVMNLNGMPTIPSFHNGAVPGNANPNVLPPFNDLQANMAQHSQHSQQHHISNTINTINTNNNIRINGVTGAQVGVVGPSSSSTTRTTIVIDGEGNAQSAEASSAKSKSKGKSRKRKRGGEEKGKKKKKRAKSRSRSIKDDSSSDSESTEDSDDDSDLSSSYDSDARSASSRMSKNSKGSKKGKEKSKKRKSKSRRRKKSKTKKEKEKEKERERKKSKRSSKKEKAKNRKEKKGSKRALESLSVLQSERERAKKRQKVSDAEYVVVGTESADPKGQDRDANDSVCRICKHPGNLVCCEGCPSVYHADCIRPRIRKKWLDAFEEWYCPSCAPRYAHMPLRNKTTKAKWPVEQEPLLCDLKGFLEKHSELERDPEPDYHPSRKAGNKH